MYTGPQIITDGLAFCLDAANPKSYPGSGTTWKDIVSNNDGTLTNGPTFSTDGKGSIVFDDTNDYVTYGNISPTGFEYTDPFSIEFWFKRTNNGVTHIIVNKNQSSGNYTGWEFGLLNTNQVSFVIRSTNTVSTRKFLIDNNAYTDGSWKHVVGTYDGANSSSSTQLYIDGVADYTLNSNNGDISGGITNTSPLVLGARNAAQHFFGGNLASVKIYGKELTSDEVLQNYNVTKQRFK